MQTLPTWQRVRTVDKHPSPGPQSPFRWGRRTVSRQEARLGGHNESREEHRRLDRQGEHLPTPIPVAGQDKQHSQDPDSHAWAG